MKIRNGQLKSRAPDHDGNAARRFYRLAGWLGLAATLILIFTASAVPAYGQTGASTPPSQAPPDRNVQCVLGLPTMRHNTMGVLTVQPDALQFASEKAKAGISIASILDLFTSNDSKQLFSGVGGTLARTAVPYGGGRVLALFSHATEVLTVEYKDADGGYHGAIFVLPKGQASAIKAQLVAHGAHASIPPEAPGTEEKKP
ncbi:MAG TPA: hypothetical protein VJW51_01725 [Candidatus Acidoferrales bacterium]|nr:hypothetical protein [Candidatus Acidoferrales bacterium]